MFPPNAGTSGGVFAPADTKLQLSANTGVEGTGTVQAHLIPTVWVLPASVFLPLRVILGPLWYQCSERPGRSERELGS